MGEQIMEENASAPAAVTPAGRPKVAAPKKPATSALERMLAEIPTAILERIARHGILRNLAPYEASKLVILVANQAETHELAQAARDLETVFFVAPQRLTAGRIAGTQWDEGMRVIRTKVRELRETIEAVARGWTIRFVRPVRGAAIPAHSAYGGISSEGVPPVGLPPTLDAVPLDDRAA